MARPRARPCTSFFWPRCCSPGSPVESGKPSLARGLRWLLRIPPAQRPCSAVRTSGGDLAGAADRAALRPRARRRPEGRGRHCRAHPGRCGRGVVGGRRRLGIAVHSDNRRIVRMEPPPAAVRDLVPLLEAVGSEWRTFTGELWQHDSPGSRPASEWTPSTPDPSGDVRAKVQPREETGFPIR